MGVRYNVRTGGLVSDRTPVILGAIAGALVGGVVGYVLFTEEGRRLQAELEPRLRDVLAELGRARDVARDVRMTVTRARQG
jgi:hypothetical protein